MDGRQARRLASAASPMSMTGFGNFGGAFLLLNALSSRIHNLIEDSTNTIVAGYERGGVWGLVGSTDFRALLRRYIWLLAVAFAFEKVRKLWSFFNIFGGITQYLYIDALLKPGDQAYEWVLAFWEHSQAFKGRSRDFLIETGPKSKRKQAARPGLNAGEMSIYSGGQGAGSNGDGKNEDEMVTRLSPKENSEQYIWHKGTLFRFRRWTQQSTSLNLGWGNGPAEQSLISVRSYSFTRKPLFHLLDRAREVYESTRPQMVTIRVLDQQRGTWRRVAYRHRRPLSSVIMPEDKKEELLRDAREFLLSETWYGNRGIPWKRGYMLTGPPGTGKSSTIQAIASEVKLDVYVLSINSPTMNDGMLQAAFRSVPAKSILVIEDVDALNVQKRELDQPKAPAPMPAGRHLRGSAAYYVPPSTGSQISLSALLNCIDGIEGNEGRLLFLTTNALDSLDPALVRAGRVDLFIEYSKATREQAEQLFKIFYTPSQAALTEDEDILKRPTSSSSASSHEESGAESAHTPRGAPRHKARVQQPFDLPASITSADIDRWAFEWAAGVPDHTFSIAELQGMLLVYKTEPERAVDEMEGWVEKELKAKRDAEEEKGRKEKQNQKQEENNEKQDKDAGLEETGKSGAEAASGSS